MTEGTYKVIYGDMLGDARNVCRKLSPLAAFFAAGNIGLLLNTSFYANLREMRGLNHD